MSELVADCPRCGSQKMTFDVRAQTVVAHFHRQQIQLELFCVCRRCSNSTVFIAYQSADSEYFGEELHNLDISIDRLIDKRGYISIRDHAANPPPKHLPKEIENVFKEGSMCMAVNCYNAAATMFRLCLDLATKPLIDEELSAKAKRSLGLRLPWLFDNEKLPADLRDLSTCIKDDGNDGAHEGTISKEDAADILDFTFNLLERLYTQPEQIKIANERRKERRRKD